MTSSAALKKIEGSMFPEQLANWPSLTDEQRALAACYVENSYSLKDTAKALHMAESSVRKELQSPVVRKAVLEVQESLGEIDFLNERWVKEQILRLYPKLVGEEAVPFIDNQGIQVEAKRFYPEAALRVLEYVSPKAAAGKSGTNIQVNIDLGAFGIQKVDVNG